MLTWHSDCNAIRAEQETLTNREGRKMRVSLKVEIDDVTYMKVNGKTTLASGGNIDVWDLINENIEKLFGQGKAKLIREEIEID